MYVAHEEELDVVAILLFSVLATHPQQLLSLFILTPLGTRSTPALSKIVQALQFMGVEVLCDSIQTLASHVESRRLFYQVVCLIDDAGHELPSDARASSNNIQLFRISVRGVESQALQASVDIEQLGVSRPSLIKRLPNNKNLAFALVRSSRHASKTFVHAVRVAVAHVASNHQFIQRWLHKLQVMDTP